MSYLIELVVDEPVDQGWLSDSAVPDQDYVAVVSGLRQTVADTAHHSHKPEYGGYTQTELSNANYGDVAQFKGLFMSETTSSRHKSRINTETHRVVVT